MAKLENTPPRRYIAVGPVCVTTDPLSTLRAPSKAPTLALEFADPQVDVMDANSRLNTPVRSSQQPNRGRRPPRSATSSVPLPGYGLEDRAKRRHRHNHPSVGRKRTRPRDTRVAVIR